MIPLKLKTRREFMVAATRWGLDLAFLSVIPFASCSHAQTPQENSVATDKKMTLKQIVQQKRHYGSDRFMNPFAPARKNGFSDFLKWKLFSDNNFKEQYADETVNPVKIDWVPITNHDGLSVTFINHASVLIRDAGVSILVDPVFFGLFSFQNFTPLEFDIDTMPKPDHVLITHGHYDHLDKDTLSVFDPKTHVITPLGYDSVFSSIGMKNRTKLDWFDAFDDGERQIILLPCNHWTMRNPIVGPNRSLWGSYLIRTKAGPTIFISGDTAYFQGFKEIGERYDIDLAILSVGAYEPRWFMKQSHMNPAEAVQAMKDLKAKSMFIIHWGTFRLGDEPVHVPPVDVRRELQKANMADRLLNINHGDTLYF
jgi:N-acyl-phosphatidylethanolamine-hydrolysing phospholipase D